MASLLLPCVYPIFRTLIFIKGLHENRPLHLHTVEPGNLAVILAFHRGRANRLPEQTQRRVYSCAASALRRGGVAWRIFRWEGEPQRKAQKRLLRLYVEATHVCTSVYIRIIASTSGVTPSSHTAFNYSTQHLHGTATERTVYAPGSL
jgi:hypothetical protein